MAKQTRQVPERTPAWEREPRDGGPRETRLKSSLLAVKLNKTPGPSTSCFVCYVSLCWFLPSFGDQALHRGPLLRV